jgi:hypothetical protein
MTVTFRISVVFKAVAHNSIIHLCALPCAGLLRRTADAISALLPPGRHQDSNLLKAISENRATAPATNFRAWCGVLL